MAKKIAINSKTSGKFETRMLNNREHIVTDMIPIVGNSVMNKGAYLLPEVQNTFDQLNNLPAPNGHPRVNNQLVSAFHPVAVNAFNIGGFVRNPTMDGNVVHNEFWLDKEIANQSDDGQELIRRIENGEEVGVSTGLSVRQEMANGEIDGQTYEWIARDLNFDHVAILLNEKAAGAHVGTALQTNSVSIVNCAEVSEEENALTKAINSLEERVVARLRAKPDKTNSITSHDLNDQLRALAREIYPEASFWVWVMVTFPTENQVVFEVESKTDSTVKLVRYSYSIDQNDQVSLNDDGREVVKKVEFVAVDGDVNVNNSNPTEDDDMGDKKDPEKPQDVSNDGELNVENAVKLLESKGFKVNTKEEAEQMQFFVDNKDKFEAIINKENAEADELRKTLVENTDLTEDDVKGMSLDMLKKLSPVKSVQNYALSAGGATPQVVEEASDGDYETDYTVNLEKTGDE